MSEDVTASILQKRLEKLKNMRGVLEEAIEEASVKLKEMSSRIPPGVMSTKSEHHYAVE